MLQTKIPSAFLLGTLLLTCVGCGTQTVHPNQINKFDGASYDSLTLAHAALTSMRETVSSQYPQYRPVFNEAVASYAVAFNAYAAFRVRPVSQATAALAIANLTVSLVSLEGAFQQDLHVSPATVHSVHNRAMRIKASLEPHVSVSDVLTELEIAATIAQTVPATEPYSTIAAIVIKTTQDALLALNSSSAQAIDLSTIQPIAPVQ